MWGTYSILCITVRGIAAPALPLLCQHALTVGAFNCRKGQSFGRKGQLIMVTGGSLEIGILIYPGVQAAPVQGLTDLFGIAVRFALERRSGDRSPLRLTHWRLAEGRDRTISCTYDSDPRGNPGLEILIIPPTMVGLPDPDVPAGLKPWLRRQHARGTKLISICSGAFILAQTGLVDGRSVSTHRICAEALAKRFPEIVVDATQRIIDEGDIMTAGGFMAWIDVGLLLVDRALGSDVRAETARFIVSDSVAGQARYFAGLAPRQGHRDLAIRRALESVHMKDGRGVSLASMAATAGLERRTFLRRFSSATGMTPIEYCRAVRVARARELLEFGNTPLKRIAQSLGYNDVASFSRVFRRATGLAPGAYRKNFGRAAGSPDEPAPTISSEIELPRSEVGI